MVSGRRDGAGGAGGDSEEMKRSNPILISKQVAQRMLARDQSIIFNGQQFWITDTGKVRVAPKGNLASYREFNSVAAAFARVKKNPVSKQKCSRCGSTYYVDSECPICQANPSIGEACNAQYWAWLRTLSLSQLNAELKKHNARSPEADAIRTVITQRKRKNPGFFTTTRQRKPVDSLQLSVSRKKKAKGGADAFGVPNPEPTSCANCPHASWQHARQGDPRLVQSRGRYYVGDCYVKGCRCVGYKSSAKNPGLFGPEAVASAKRVTRVRRVRQKDTGELGEIVGSPGQGWLKVKWDNRQRPTLIRRSEIAAVRANGIISNFRQIRAHDNARIAEAERKGRLKGIEEMTQELLSDPFYRKHPDLRRAQLHYLNTRRKALAKPIKIPKWKNPKGATIWMHTAKATPGGAKEEKARLSKHYFDAGKRIASEGNFRSATSAFRTLFTQTPWRIDKRVGFTRGDAEKAFMSGYRVKNPSVTDLARTFQGKANGAVSQYKAANSAPSDLARIGKLVFLKLRDVRKQIAAPGAMVAVDTRGKLWLTTTRAPMFSNKAKPGTVNDFGEIEKICYLTAKQHIGNSELTEYVHSFGEDGGKRPHLLVDHEGMPILRGGDYKIRAEGIVN